MPEYVAIAAVDDIEEGAIRGYVIGNQEIAIARCDGEFYAVDAICSHAHAYLYEGEVDTDDCVVECPLHGARFSLSTGRVRALPASEPIKVYQLRISEGTIEVALEQ
jgi:3-phenylpropionate/trans-cinnamate dioxygenase ferredoxin component